MNIVGVIDGTVAVVVIGGCIWAILALFFLALVGAGSIEDQAMEEYLREEHGLPRPEPDPFDLSARQWIADERRSS